MGTGEVYWGRGRAVEGRACVRLQHSAGAALLCHGPGQWQRLLEYNTTKQRRLRWWNEPVASFDSRLMNVSHSLTAHLYYEYQYCN